ncbi:hypothetical protein [Methylobacterium sp. Leaf106]|uniref:hypothetical protein n=1 Tax=Methylobacterium sp. Leaf106 TaxID=1736255 RepID=UPI0006FA8127|nr:hypothetical protein [Methylobacterium sp. Leaf106]KQP53060.1 hypothetical protein ASF34_01445 [Methylobacterium sp. Leaf106]
MSVLTVPRIRASEAHDGRCSSLGLADQMGSLDLVGPFESRLPLIDSPIPYVLAPWIAAMLVAWLLGA